VQKCSTIFRSTVGRGVCPFDRSRKISKRTPGLATGRTDRRWIASGVTAYAPHSSQSTETPVSDDAKSVCSSLMDAGKLHRKQVSAGVGGGADIRGDLTTGAVYACAMRRPDAGLLILVPLLALALARPSRARAADPSPRPVVPPTRTTDAADVLHGVTVRDPYRWLEDEKSPEVQAWMKAQDDAARQSLASLPQRAAIAARLKDLLYVDSLGAPVHRGSRYFFTRRHADREKSIVYWKEGPDGAEKVLLDPNGWSSDGSAGLGGWSVSWDGTKVAYQKKVNNSDEATLTVMDVATGKVSDLDAIEGAKYAYASWTPDGSAFYYTHLPVDPKIPSSERPGWADVRLHRIGTDPNTDAIVKEKLGDPTAFQHVVITRDGRFLFLVVSHGWTSSDVSFRDLEKDASLSSWTPLAVGVKAHFEVDNFGRTLFVKTDDGAPRGRVFAVDPAKPARAAWKEIVPERRDASLQSFGVVGGKLALEYLKSASSLLEVRNLDGTLLREVPLPGIGSASNLSGRDDEDEAHFSFTSYTTPTAIYRTSVRTGATSLYFQVKVPADVSPYTVTQVFYPSKDGTRVSMFIVHRKDFKRDGSARAILEGYGGFLVSLTPAFSASLFPWLERGGIYAVPNLRGGGEYGEEWHERGMLLKKQNVFDDFAAAAAYLEKEKWTSPGRLVLRGGSNGGLLLGAAITQHPELFRVALCGVPLLDMVRYHLFGSGKTWISEYGSADDAAQFKALYAYSPTHHVKAGTKYPSVLLLSADSDDRVDPMHARKFAAELQAASTGGPVLLRIEKHAGHGGADLVKSAVEARADEYAFALAETPETVAAPPVKH
jgi:prolyl oligopeptidase